MENYWINFGDSVSSFLATKGKTELIYMGNDVFRPEADVTTVVLKFVRSGSEKGKLMLFDFYVLCEVIFIISTPIFRDEVLKTCGVVFLTPNKN